ncbi:hypothetical protein Tco_0228060 [Tanacetum coccineum]
MVSFINDLEYTAKCDMLSEIHTDHMHQPWRTIAAIINKCISRKSTGLDRLRPSRAQILWGMFYQKNVDFVALLWEDFMFQADNREISFARKENMPYPRFTKVITSHFIFKDKTISMRNMINLHTVRNDSLLGTLKFVSKTQDYQMYGALTSEEMINQDIKDSKAYRTYLAFDTGKATPKKVRKFKKVASPSKKLSPVLEEEPVKKPKQAKKPTKKSTTMPIAGVVIRDTPGVPVSKKKAPANVDRGKGMDLLSDSQEKQAGNSQASCKWLSDADGDNEASDSEKTDFDEEDNLNLNQNDDEEEEYVEEYVCITDKYEFSDDDEEYEELYKDVNVRLKDAEHKEEGKRDADMTDAGHDGVSQEKSYEQVEDDAHVTLTVAYVTQKTEGPMQSSFVSSDFASEFLNLDNVPPTNNEVVSMMNVKVRHDEPSTRTPSLLTIPVTIFPETLIAATTTTPSTILPITPLPQLSTPTPTPAPTTKTTTTSIPVLPDFSSLFRFDQRVSVLEKELSRLSGHTLQNLRRKLKTLPKEVSDFATLVIQITITESLKNVIFAKSFSQPQSSYEEATSITEIELKKILLDKMQKTYSLKRDREDKDKDEDPLAGSDQGFKRWKTSRDVEPLKGSKSKESKLSSSKGTMSQPKSSYKSTQAKESVSPQTWISKIAQVEKPPFTFDEPMSTPIDFSTYVMNNLKIDNLTQEHLVGPAFNLLKGTCRSQVELEYHFEECYKAITDQLDVNNPEGHEYPFDLRKPLPLIEDQGCQVVVGT